MDDNPDTQPATPTTPYSPHDGDENEGPHKEEKNMAALAHLAAFAGYIIPFGNIIGPVILYCVKKNESEYIAYHARESINFQISILIYLIISVILCFVIIGFFLLAAVTLLNIVCVIIAAIKASEGKRYVYPVTIRFL